MLRGINRQDIFDDTEYYWTFIRMMSEVPCYIYAYCLMSNHVHLLIAEKSLKVGEVVKSIASCYVLYYNKKYGRIGHLLQDRFKSEPCNDSGYFLTLFRYIHQNPVKAGLSKTAKDYMFSSWGNDYLGQALQRACHIEPVIKRYGIDELTAWVDMPLPGCQVLCYLYFVLFRIYFVFLSNIPLRVLPSLLMVSVSRSLSSITITLLPFTSYFAS